MNQFLHIFRPDTELIAGFGVGTSSLQITIKDEYEQLHQEYNRPFGMGNSLLAMHINRFKTHDMDNMCRLIDFSSMAAVTRGNIPVIGLKSGFLLGPFIDFKF